MRIPIACTLSAGDAGDRLEEWRNALRASVTGATRPAPARLELRIADTAAAAGQLVDLARREKGCCGFFTFTVEIAADVATLVVEVPEDAVAILDDFALLAGG